METFLIYIIKSTCCLSLFYVFYKALLSRETFFRFNRFVLLGGIFICAILPFIELQIEKGTIIQAPIRHVETLIAPEKIPTTDIDFVEQTDINSNNKINTLTPIVNKKENSSFTLSVFQLISLIYISGLFMTIVLLIISVIKMINLIRKGRKISENSDSIILTNRKICPFSFGKYIVISESDYEQNPDEILIHERIHIQKKHSIDLLLTEFFILLHWFNPVIWLLKRELQEVHEYEADNGVIDQGIDAIKYQLLLVKKAVGARSYTIANSFNHSKIKNRITMMLKEKSTQWARLKLLLFVPVAAVALQAFARPEISGISESKTLSTNEVTKISQEIKKGSREYWDNAVAEFLKRPEAAGSTNTWLTYYVHINNRRNSLSITHRVTYNNKGEEMKISELVVGNMDLSKSLNGYLINESKKSLKLGKIYPQIIFLNIESGTSEDSINKIYNVLNATNEEILELRKKATNTSRKEIIVPDPSPENDAFLVVINEKIKQFPNGKYGEAPLPPPIKKDAKKTKRFTPKVSSNDSSVVVVGYGSNSKKTEKITELVEPKDVNKKNTPPPPPAIKMVAKKNTSAVYSKDTVVVLTGTSAKAKKVKVTEIVESASKKKGPPPPPLPKSKE